MEAQRNHPLYYHYYAIISILFPYFSHTMLLLLNDHFENDLE